MPDTQCPSDAPFCQAAVCTSCADLPVATCGNTDPALPACDLATGQCVECTEENDSFCGGTTPICANQKCVGCTLNSECATQSCLPDGSCLEEDIALEGAVLEYGKLADTPKKDATVKIVNIPADDLVLPPPTTDDGLYTVSGIPPYSLVQLEVTGPHSDAPFTVSPTALRTVQTLRVENATPVDLDPRFVSYGWLGEVAFQCGIFDTLGEAYGASSINPYFITNSTIVGELVDPDGSPTSEQISRTAVQVRLSGYVNLHGGYEGQVSDTHVCFLDEDPGTGKWRGTTSTFSTASGRFVMFRVRNNAGTGQGVATVRVKGFDAQTVTVSSGNIGLVRLVRNTDTIQRSFLTDIYPIFSTYGCNACHSPGTAIYDSILVDRERCDAQSNCYLPDWSADPETVYQNLVGPGTTCTDPTGWTIDQELLDGKRVCLNEPEYSLLLKRPIGDEPPFPGPADPHPIDIFSTIDDPTATVILEWIEQGAPLGDAPGPVEFETDIYPLFNQYGCNGCHNPSTPVWASTLATRERCNAVSSECFLPDWSGDAMAVYDNLVGPGTNCPSNLGSGPPSGQIDTAEARVCTTNPLNSLMLVRPVADAAYPGYTDPHPVAIFGSLEEDDAALITRWIQEGAKFAP
jgi:hypothetical protein